MPDFPGFSQQGALYEWRFDEDQEILDPAYLDEDEYKIPATVESKGGDPYSIFSLGKFVPGVKAITRQTVIK